MIHSRCELNEAYKDILIKDSVLIEFNFLYPNIILKLDKLGALLLNNPFAINELRKYLLKENKTSDDRYFINTFFLSLSKDDRNKVIQCANAFNDRLEEDFQDLIIYIDTDTAYFTKVNDDILNLYSKIDIPFTLFKIEYAYFLDIKKYIYSELNEIKYSNLLLTSSNAHLKETCFSKFLCEIRNDKLNKILV